MHSHLLRAPFALCRPSHLLIVGAAITECVHRAHIRTSHWLCNYPQGEPSSVTCAIRSISVTNSNSVHPVHFWTTPECVVCTARRMRTRDVVGCVSILSIAIQVLCQEDCKKRFGGAWGEMWINSHGMLKVRHGRHPNDEHAAALCTNMSICTSMCKDVYIYWLVQGCDQYIL